jgi:predicted nucleic acid-binding protein
MIILDTNVLSALMTEPADLGVVAWLDRQARISMWTTSITILEIRFGLDTMADGRRRKSRLSAFRRLIDEKLEQRVAPFDQSAAEAAAALMAVRKAAGQGGDLRDSMIAGIVLARRAALATRNVKHFADVEVEIINPWEASRAG